jgi:hypothetical protein
MRHGCHQGSSKDALPALSNDGNDASAAGNRTPGIAYSPGPPAFASLKAWHVPKGRAVAARCC